MHKLARPVELAGGIFCCRMELPCGSRCGLCKPTCHPWGGDPPGGLTTSPLKGEDKLPSQASADPPPKDNMSPQARAFTSARPAIVGVRRSCSLSKGRSLCVRVQMGSVATAAVAVAELKQLIKEKRCNPILIRWVQGNGEHRGLAAGRPTTAPPPARLPPGPGQLIAAVPCCRLAWHDAGTYDKVRGPGCLDLLPV